MVKPGTRVVRGPDWASKKQDCEEGFHGTIIYVPKQDSGDDRVTVIWDSGRELRYRAGKNGKYDLRIIDSGPAGITHPGVTCNECHDQPIKGIRWKNAVNPDVSLCTSCYMDDKDNTSDAFVRFETKDSQPVGVPPRNLSQNTKKMRRGSFPDGEVMRGPHWRWRNDDEGELGHIKRVVTWGSDSYRGGVEVMWKNDNAQGCYRVGGEGSVDVIFVRIAKAGKGGYYYPGHLPVVDIVGHGVIAMIPSDKVKVNLTLKNFQRLQKSDNNLKWQDEMNQCLNEVGTIIEIMADGSYKVQYEDASIWELHKKSLYRIHSFVEEEAIEILPSRNAVKDLQKGHGGWCEDMASDLGKTGRIINISTDGDIKVKMSKKVWTFNPVCVMFIEDASKANKVPLLEKADVQQTSSPKQRYAIMEAVTNLTQSIANIHGNMLHIDVKNEKVNIVQKATQGDLKAIRDILEQHPNKVDDKVDGKTALQMACYEGFTDIVQLLLEHKADTNQKDSAGDTPLHYAVFGKEVQSMKLLLKYNAKVDIQNERKQTALHIAVVKASLECVELLINHGSDLNIQDEDGETPMHYAVVQKEGQSEMLNLILNSQSADFTIQNENGLNVLHWSVVKNVTEALTLILKNNKRIVDVPSKGDQYTALHIAAANDYDHIARILIIQGNCNIDAKDKHSRTSLFICISKKSHKTMEQLISAGAQVDIQDENGNTPLHVALRSKLMFATGTHDDETLDNQIICALLEARSNVHIKNKESYTPLDLAPDNDVRLFMEKLSADAHANKLATTKRGIALPLNWSPMGNFLWKPILLQPDAGGMMQMEWGNVSQKFLKSLPQAKILAIKRVQNMTLWETYVLCRMKISNSRPSANEMTLYHNSAVDSVDEVFQFNIEYRETRDPKEAKLGMGAYFTVNAKYADGSAEADTNGHKYIFICKVLIGQSTEGHPSYKRPPQLDPKDVNSELYESCVDNLKDPKTYCVFDKNQYYPEYLIEYM